MIFVKESFDIAIINPRDGTAQIQKQHGWTFKGLGIYLSREWQERGRDARMHTRQVWTVIHLNSGHALMRWQCLEPQAQEFMRVFANNLDFTYKGVYPEPFEPFKRKLQAMAHAIEAIIIPLDADLGSHEESAKQIANKRNN